MQALQRELHDARAELEREQAQHEAAQSAAGIRLSGGRSRAAAPAAGFCLQAFDIKQQRSTGGGACMFHTWHMARSPIPQHACCCWLPAAALKAASEMQTELEGRAGRARELQQAQDKLQVST